MNDTIILTVPPDFFLTFVFNELEVMTEVATGVA